jgi:hypothetical protein
VTPPVKQKNAEQVLQYALAVHSDFDDPKKAACNTSAKSVPVRVGALLLRMLRGGKMCSPLRNIWYGSLSS